MKVLIFGSGGREHALAWAVAKNERVTELVCAPGNGGMASLGSRITSRSASQVTVRLVPVSLSDLDGMVQIAVAEQAGLTIVGPELPLSLGLVDALELRGLKVFGPARAAAMLESSKSFAKRFLQRHQIPTANYAVCASLADVEKAIEFFHAPIVVKADGLAAGKGVVICQSRRAALEAAHGLFTGKLIGTTSGAGEQQLVIEEFLAGEEVSFLCLSDGSHVVPLAPAQDHKRIGEGDTGPNTGGMGVYSTDAILEPEMREWVMHHIARPTIRGMADEDAPFKGVLYIGLMMTARGPQVLEFNTRFGDPETQAIVVRLESDLLEALEACVEGRLAETELRWKAGASACVIASSGGYPGSFQIGFEITGLGGAAEIPEVEVFHSGTALSGGKLRSSGGRVLGVTASASTLTEALRRAYEALGRIHFEGMYFRRDIGRRALNKPGPTESPRKTQSPQ
jgi:phosphoribosylamine---glycine ligase